MLHGNISGLLNFYYIAPSCIHLLTINTILNFHNPHYYAQHFQISSSIFISHTQHILIKLPRIITTHMAKPSTILFKTLFIVYFHQSQSATFNIVDLGANPNGEIESTNSMLKAWTLACASITPPTIYVPQGRFLLKDLHFKGPCNNNAVTFRINGTLVAPISDYGSIGGAANWLLFEGAHGVSIQGGVLDGHGAALWACKMSGNKCPDGATVRYHQQFY